MQYREMVLNKISWDSSTARPLLETLTMQFCNVSKEWVETLAKCPTLSGLEQLNLGYNNIGPEGSTPPSKLDYLSLVGN